MKWGEAVPVLASMGVIVAIALLERYSRLIAAITATMPLTAALGLWIVYASAQGERAAVEEFTSGMLVGIFPTLAFLVSIWLGARAGLRLIPLLLLGYGAWGAALMLLLRVRRLWGMG